MKFYLRLILNIKKIVDIIKDLIVYKRYIFFENITQKDSFEKDNNESFKSGSDLNECDNENFSNSDNQIKRKIINVFERIK